MGLKILSVVGARPDFIKLAAICEAIDECNYSSGREDITHLLVHTGQHYDINMSDLFFNDLDLPRPDIFLDARSGSHAAQTARIMEKFENVVLAECPDVVLVVGDVNSTLACALATKKTWCPGAVGGGNFLPKLAHVEAGLRSFDRNMPEEINRIVTDSIADFLFTTEESANLNLAREGIDTGKIHFVGSVMIDTLLRHRPKSRESTILDELQLANGSMVKPYVLLTVHRPSNVDDPEVLSKLFGGFLEISKRMQVIFPAHPRTLQRIREAGLGDCFVDYVVDGSESQNSRARIRLLPPLGYLDFIRLMSDAKVVCTDSGSVQEETTMLHVPCLTLRDNTERPVSIEEGTNVLVGSDPERIKAGFNKALQTPVLLRSPPRYWDGQAARRIVAILVQKLAPNFLAPTLRGASTTEATTSARQNP